MAAITEKSANVEPEQAKGRNIITRDTVMDSVEKTLQLAKLDLDDMRTKLISLEGMCEIIRESSSKHSQSEDDAEKLRFREIIFTNMRDLTSTLNLEILMSRIKHRSNVICSGIMSLHMQIKESLIELKYKLAALHTCNTITQYRTTFESMMKLVLQLRGISSSTAMAEHAKSLKKVIKHILNSSRTIDDYASYASTLNNTIIFEKGGFFYKELDWLIDHLMDYHPTCCPQYVNSEELKEARRILDIMK